MAFIAITCLWSVWQSPSLGLCRVHYMFMELKAVETPSHISSQSLCAKAIMMEEDTIEGFGEDVTTG